MPRRGPLIGGDNTIEDPGYVFADDGGDPLGARNRATMLADRQAAQEAQQREQDRQTQFLLAQYGQDQQNARLAYTTQAEQQSQARRQALEARAQDMSAQQKAAETQQWAQKDWQDFILRGYDAEQNRNQQDQHFQQAGQQGAYEFEQRQGQQADQFDRSHQQAAEQFALSRQPSERDRWQGDLQSQHMQEQAQVHAWLQQQELTNTEQARLQRSKNSVGMVNDALQKGEIDPDTAARAIARLKTDIDPLETRQRNAQMAHMQMQDNLLLHQAAKQAQIEEMNAQQAAKTFAERVGSYTDENGKVWRGFQTKQGQWEVHNPYEQEQKEREHALKIQQGADTKNETLRAQHEGRLNSAVKQTTSQWQSDYTNMSRQVDKEIQDAQRQAEKKGYDDDPEKKAAEQRWVAKLKDNRDSMIHDRMKQTKRWKDVGADKDALDAALEADKQSKMESWQPPLQSRGTQQPQAPPPSPVQQQHERDRIPGGMTINPPQWANPGAPAAAPQAPPQAAPPQQAAAGGALQQIDQMIDEAHRGGNQSVGVSATRIKAALSKYGTIAQMPPAERQQFLRDLKNAGLEQ